MAVTFNTNVSALTAQRYMGAAGDAAASSLSKLSSGSRVPTAKDDAAGLAIGTKLKAEVAGLQQAGNNAAQAISLLQIADGALSTVSDVLQRMKSLAVQSSSGQLSNADRGLLNQEFQNLKSEVDRIANITNFNGTTLLQGGGNGPVLVDEVKNGGLAAVGLAVTVDQGTATSGDAFRITYDHVDNGGAYDAGDPDTYNTDVYNLTVTNTTTGDSQTINIRELLAAKKGNYDPTSNLAAGTSLDVSFGSLGVTVTLNENFNIDADLTPAATTGANTAMSGFTTAAALDVEWAGDGIDQDTIDALQGLSIYNAQTGNLTITLNTTGAGNATLDGVTGLRYSVNGAPQTADNTDSDNFGTAATAFVVDVYTAGGDKLFTLTREAGDLVSAGAGTATFSFAVPALSFGQEFTAGADTSTFSFKVGTGVSTNDNISFDLTATRATDLGINASTIDTAVNADAAIGEVNSAIATVASRRADVGAAQSRLQFASDSIAVSIENTTSAQSAIMDVDVSSEITTFTSKQVLLQAGVSLLAQANQQPALLLRLLQ